MAGSVCARISFLTLSLEILHFNGDNFARVLDGYLNPDFAHDQSHVGHDAAGVLRRHSFRRAIGGMNDIKAL
jgi:hypothetical protein